MARPRFDVSKAGFSFTNLSTKDVRAKHKVPGIKSTESNVYRVRRLAKENGATNGAARRGRPHSTKPTMSSSASTLSAESIMRAVSAEIGLGRALDILQAERSKVWALLG